MTGTQSSGFTGVVFRTWLVTPGGLAEQHKVVGIQKPDGESIIADLGTPGRLPAHDVTEGELVTVYGPSGRVGSQPALVVTRIERHEGEQPAVDQYLASVRPFKGELLASWTATLQGETHRLADFRMTNGRIRLVDLGPQDNLRNFDLLPGDEMTLMAYPGRLYGQDALVAQQFRNRGQYVRVEPVQAEYYAQADQAE